MEQTSIVGETTSQTNTTFSKQMYMPSAIAALNAFYVLLGAILFVVPGNICESSFSSACAPTLEALTSLFFILFFFILFTFYAVVPLWVVGGIILFKSRKTWGLSNRKKLIIISSVYAVTVLLVCVVSFYALLKLVTM